MKIKRFFKLRKGDCVIASNAEEGLYVIKTSSGNIKVYRDGNLFSNIEKANKSSYYSYTVQYANPRGALVYDFDNGLISYIEVPEYYWKDKIIFRNDFTLRVLDAKSRESYTIMQDIKHCSINYLATGGRNPGLVLNIRNKDFTKFYVLGNQNPMFTIDNKVYAGYSFMAIDTQFGIAIKRFNKRDYRDVTIVKQFSYEEIFNFVPSKGELK